MKLLTSTIDNKPGAGGIIGSVAGNSAPADGNHFIITPADTTNTLDLALDAASKLPEVREKLQAQVPEPVGVSPFDLKQFQDNDIQKWTKVAHTAKVSL